MAITPLSMIRKRPRIPAGIQWFIYDLENLQLITTPIIPGDISDTKNIVYAEQQIPGLNYQPVVSGGMGNRKVSFTIQLIRRDSIVGNVLMLKQFENLRNPSFLMSSLAKSSQFTANPKVLYHYGIGSVPLVWYVAKCDATHKQGWVNAAGMPQYSEISMELVLDEASPANKMEEMFRKLSSYAGSAQSILDIVETANGRTAY